MKRKLEIGGCLNCPHVGFSDGVSLDEFAVQIVCTHMNLWELVKGGSAQKEIDILSDWFENKCDLEQIE